MTAKECILKSDDEEIEECEEKIGAGAGSSRSFNRGRGYATLRQSAGGD